MKLSKEITAFIKDIDRQTKRIGVRFKLYENRKHLLIQNSKVNGYFNFIKGTYELACATNKPVEKWLHVLVHEFSHFEQWKSNHRIWQLGFMGNVDASEYFFDWIDGKNFSKKKICEIVWKTRMVELDCEKRSVKNIKKYKLPIDIPTYIQKANTYILFHNYVQTHRKWYKRAPYENKKVYSQFPTKFLSTYTKIAQKYINLFDKYCF